MDDPIFSEILPILQKIELQKQLSSAGRENTAMLADLELLTQRARELEVKSPLQNPLKVLALEIQSKDFDHRYTALESELRLLSQKVHELEIKIALKEENKQSSSPSMFARK